MRTIFHVGHAKTGTTALQAIMEASRATMLGRGVLYPSNPNGSYRNHRLVFAHLFEPGQVPRHILKNYERHELPAAHEEMAASVRREIAEHRPDCVVMSSESRFAVWNERQREGFRAAMEALGCGGVEIAAYVRRPSSWYLSAVQQHLRASHEIKPPRMLRLAAALEQFEEDFGRDRVHVRPFDRAAMVGGDVMVDFAAAYLRPHGVAADALTRPPQDNHSLSAESFDLSRRWRQAFHPDEPNRYLAPANALNRILAVVEAQVGPPKPTMDPGLAELIDYSRDDVLLVRDRFGVELPGYDYTRVERGELTRVPQESLTIERIVTIDRAVQARIVERLRETRWAVKDPARRRWLEELPDRIEAEERARRRLDQISGRGLVAPGGRAARTVPLASLWTPRRLGAGARVATLGAGLAEALGPALGGAWIDAEPAPAGLAEGRARRRGHGRHSARTGPVPTATLLERWTAWALGEARPPEGLRREGDRVVDMLRADVVPAGFASAEEALADRGATLAALGAALRGASAVVLEPAGAVAGEDAAGAEVAEAGSVVRRTVQDAGAVARALAAAAERVRRANPDACVVLALSPAMRGDPVAQMESRAVLRAAMGRVAREVEGVEYAPSFEASLDEPDADCVAASELAAALLGPARDARPRLRAEAV